MTNPWDNKGMTSYPENHINRNSTGFRKKKTDNWFKSFLKKIFKILRNET